MPYIYRYLDRSDGVYKYVGISKNKDTLRQRIKSHEHDYWHRCGNWYIDYAFVKSKADVEFLEGVLIAEHGTWAWYNVAKATWGHSVLFDVPRLNWKVFQWGDDESDECKVEINVSETSKIGAKNTYNKRIEELIRTIEEERDKTQKAESEIERLKKEVAKLNRKNKELKERKDAAWDNLKGVLQKENGWEKKVACVATSSRLLSRSST